MTFHNLQQYEPMKMKIIKTSTYGKDIDATITEHENKVNEFNVTNNVFFNQDTRILDFGSTSGMIYSVILYAELRQQFTQQQSYKISNQQQNNQGGMN